MNEKLENVINLIETSPLQIFDTTVLETGDIITIKTIVGKSNIDKSKTYSEDINGVIIRTTPTSIRFVTAYEDRLIDISEVVDGKVYIVGHLKTASGMGGEEKDV